MRRLLMVLVSGAACACARETAPLTPDATDIDAARAATKALGDQLKSRLVSTISEDGPLAAIEVCQMDAPGVANAVSDQAGLSVARTALKVRNPANAPDAFERETLARFAAEIADGADPAALERAEIVNDADGAALRYMKPIMTAAPCTLCHGADVPDAIRAAIRERYPDDAATGFAEGDLRGAFTVTKRL